MKTRNGKRENAGRPKSEPSKTLRIPEGAIDAVEAFIRLYKNNGDINDYVVLNIAVAKTKWCQDRGDFTDLPLIKEAVREMRKKAELLDNVRFDQPDASKKWDEADQITKLADEWEKISRYGLDG
jgi:hypothetical protein